jgi:lysophospholipase
MDWRGQGGSTRLLLNPAKGHAESFARHDDDVRQFMTGIVLPDCPPPFYCLAHSMGGHLVLRLAQRKVCWWDRIILSAPMIRFAGSETAMSIRCSLAEAATILGLGDLFIPGGNPTPWEALPFDVNPLTSDRLRYERAQEVLRTAPRLGIGSPTIGWVAAACESMSLITSSAFMEKVLAPVLIVAAGNDTIVSLAAIEDYASRLKSCARIVIAGSKHEILQERDQFREQFWAAFDAYIPGSTILKRQSEQPEIIR